MKLTKQEAVGLLILSMLDYLPSVPTSTGLIQSAPGPQASAYVLCDSCAGSGRTLGGQPCVRCRDARRDRRPFKRPHRHHGCHMCMICDGRGERRRRAGDEAYDGYSGLPLSELEREIAEAHISEAARREKRARGTAVDTQVGDEIGWLRTRAAHRGAGSYDELERELAWLRDRFPFRYEMLMHWLTSHDDPLWSWSDGALERVSETIKLVAARVPTARVPSWVVRQERTRRDDGVEVLPWR